MGRLSDLEYGEPRKADEEESFDALLRRGSGGGGGVGPIAAPASESSYVGDVLDSSAEGRTSSTSSSPSKARTLRARRHKALALLGVLFVIAVALAATLATRSRRRDASNENAVVAGMNEGEQGAGAQEQDEEDGGDEGEEGPVDSAGSDPSGALADAEALAASSDGATTAEAPIDPAESEVPEVAPDVASEAGPPCDFCPDGVPDPYVVLAAGGSGANGATCGAAADFARTLSSSDAACALTKSAEG